MFTSFYSYDREEKALKEGRSQRLSEVCRQCSFVLKEQPGISACLHKLHILYPTDVQLEGNQRK